MPSPTFARELGWYINGERERARTALGARRTSRNITRRNQAEEETEVFSYVPGDFLYVTPLTKVPEDR